MSNGLLVIAGTVAFMAVMALIGIFGGMYVAHTRLV